jgi:transposase
MGNRKVILRVNPRQLKCNNCKKPFSKILSFLAKRQGFTNRYAVMITEQVIHSDVNNVAKNNGLTKVEVWSMVMFIAESIMPINVEQLKRLGRDEISLVKGQES